MSDIQTKKTKVFYDGSCPLCVAEISHYSAKDNRGALELVDVSKPGANLPEGLDAKQAMARFHVQDRDGNLRSGAAGFASLWAEVPGWRWLARIAHLPGATPLLEALYRVFLRFRPVMVRGFVAIRNARKRATRGRP